MARCPSVPLYMPTAHTPVETRDALAWPVNFIVLFCTSHCHTTFYLTSEGPRCGRSLRRVVPASCARGGGARLRGARLNPAAYRRARVRGGARLRKCVPAQMPTRP
jgi:hypothetical protein